MQLMLADLYFKWEMRTLTIFLLLPVFPRKINTTKLILILLIMY